MKRGILLFVFLLIIAINFVSSQGTLNELLDSIDQSTVIFLALFLISFSLLFFSLNKVFKKQNTAISGVISAALSFLLVYWVNKSGFDVEGSLSDIGITSNVLYTLLPIVIVAGIVYLIIKLKRDSLLAIGGLLILISFFVYAKTLLITGGIILIIIRIFLEVKFPDRRIPRGMSHREAVKHYQDAGAGI